MLNEADFLLSRESRGVAGEYGMEVCEVRDDLLDELVPLLV